MLDQLPVQRLSVEAEHPRGGSLVSGCVAKRAGDVLAHDVGEPPAAGPDGRGRRLVHTVRQIVDGQNRTEPSTRARSITFSSSRTLPGHRCCRSTASASRRPSSRACQASRRVCLGR